MLAPPGPPARRTITSAVVLTLFLGALTFPGCGLPGTRGAAGRLAAVEGTPVSPEDLLVDARKQTELIVQGGPEGSNIADVTIAVDRAHIEWLPDAGHLLYTRVEPGEPPVAWIVSVDVETGEQQRLVRGSSPRASPDGARIAYIGPDGQLWMCAGDGDRPRAVTDLALGFYLGIPAHGTFAFAPDGRSLAFAHLSDDAADPAGSMVLYNHDLVTGKQKKLLAAPLIDGVRFTPDGKRIVFASGEQPASEVVLSAVDAKSGQRYVLARRVGPASVTVAPSPSPTGTDVAFFRDRSGSAVPEFWNLAVAAVEGGPVRELTHDLYVTNIIGAGPEWRPDGRSVLFTCKTGALGRELCEVTLDGDVRFHRSKTLQEIGAWALAPDGEQVAFHSKDPRGGCSLRVMRLDGGSERVLVDFAPESAGLFACGAVEEMRWESVDGLEISGLLIRPLTDAPPPHPLIVDLHGGPHGGVGLAGQILNSSPLEWHYWAGRGFAVFAPDYRDSRVYGYDRIASLPRDEVDRLSVMDVLCGVECLISRGIADPLRLALIGHSHGAHLANRILIESDWFRVAVSKEGGVAPEVLAAVDRVTTPVLLVSAGRWPGVNQCLTFVRALRRNGVPAAQVTYANDEHVLVRPENQRDLLRKVIAFIDRHLSDQPPAP